MERISEGSVRKPRAHAETFRTDRAGGERRRTTVGLTLTVVQREEVSLFPTNTAIKLRINPPEGIQ